MLIPPRSQDRASTRCRITPSIGSNSERVETKEAMGHKAWLGRSAKPAGVPLSTTPAGVRSSLMRAKRINSDIAHIIFFLRFGGVRFHSGFPHLPVRAPGVSRLQGTPLRLPEWWQFEDKRATAMTIETKVSDHALRQSQRRGIASVGGASLAALRRDPHRRRGVRAIH